LRYVIPIRSKFKLTVAKIAKFEVYNSNSSKFKLVVAKVAKFEVCYPYS